MYRITVMTDGEEYSLKEPYADDDLQLIAPVLTLDISVPATLEFKLAVTHPNIDKLVPLSSEIYVYDDDEIIFRGRMLSPAKDFLNTLTVNCESELAYLLDSQQPPFDYTGNIPEFLKKLLDVHNSQVEERKRFELGNVTVTDSNSYTRRSSSDYMNTLYAFNRLVDVYGGYPRVRYQNGKRYLDYVYDYGGENEQPIMFAQNLLDMVRSQDATKIRTCLIPLGADVEYEDENGETQTKRIDITEVNGGKNYIEHTAGIEKYGRIWCTHRWEDVTSPENLLKKAQAYLEELVIMPETLEICAIDLSLVEPDVEKMKMGYWITVESPPHGISKQFLLKRREMHLDDPGKDRIELGQPVGRFTESLLRDKIQASEAVKKVADSASKEINRKVENATALITGGLGGYVVLDNIDPNTGKKSHPWRILIMNTPDKETAKNVIQLNQNGLGFSTTGINGPYSNAWTIDGNLVADFITAGTMLADRVRGGTLELGGTGLGSSGSIIVMDATGKRIGSWDRNGLTLLRGVLQGVSAIFGGTDNNSGSIEVKDASGATIGRWDKDGLKVTKGVISGAKVDGAVLTGGRLDIGALYADEDVVQFGDYEVSADGTNRLASTNGWIEFNTNSAPVDYPGKDYASLEIAGDGYAGVKLLGYGIIRAGTFEGGDVTFNDPWADGYSALDMFKQIYDRLDQLRREVGISWD